jgi:hypothetical protein
MHGGLARGRDELGRNRAGRIAGFTLDLQIFQLGQVGRDWRHDLQLVGLEQA